MAWGQSSGSGRDPILVMVNLFGGIDGLNWTVPYANSNYYSRRPNLALSTSEVLPLDDAVGFHPNWQPLYDTVWNDGQMAVVQKVGYPSPSRSHFNSSEIWSTARRNAVPGDRRGWIGRLADENFLHPYDFFGVGLGHHFQTMPDFNTNDRSLRPLLINELERFNLSFREEYEGDASLLKELIAEQSTAGIGASGYAGRVEDAIEGIYASAEDMALINDTYSSAVTYPSSRLGGSLREVAKIIQADLGTRILYTGQGGFDTHENQSERLPVLLDATAQALDAFITDIQDMGMWDDVCILVFSEFGRNISENGSGGTDHGFANSTVVMGGGVSGGVYGDTPTESDLSSSHSAVEYAIDFRSVLRPIVSDHLGIDPDPIFDEATSTNDEDLPLFG